MLVTDAFVVPSSFSGQAVGAGVAATATNVPSMKIFDHKIRGTDYGVGESGQAEIMRRDVPRIKLSADRRMTVLFLPLSAAASQMPQPWRSLPPVP